MPRQLYVIDLAAFFEYIQFVGAHRVHSILRNSATVFPAFRRLSAHGARRRGNYRQTEIRLMESPSPTKWEICQFLRRKDAEEWGIDIERRIDRQEPTTARQSRDVQLFGDLIALHRQDLEEVGKDIGRSKTASLIFLDERGGQLRLPELDRERFIKFGKARALEGAGPVTIGIDLGYIKTILSHDTRCTVSLWQLNQSISPGLPLGVSG